MITKIGENAGLLWNALQNGAQGLKALKKATKLKNEDANPTFHCTLFKIKRVSRMHFLLRI